MDTMQDKPTDSSTDNVARIVEENMDAIMQLMEAIAAEDPEADMKLAALLEGVESSQARVAIIEKLQALLRSMAAEKEKELEKYLDAERRTEVERQRNIFLQWLQWIMSEETLRKIREAFLASPRLEEHVIGIGHDLAAKGVFQQRQPNHSKRELGELSANVQQQGQGQGKDQGKGRQ